MIYSHDGSTPSKILGGDIQIEKADTGSHIRIITDYDTHMETAAVQDAVLNALAHKLTYSEYTNGGRNLNGTAEIAEGLTASAVTKKSGTLHLICMARDILARLRNRRFHRSRIRQNLLRRLRVIKIRMGNM